MKPFDLGRAHGACSPSKRRSRKSIASTSGLCVVLSLVSRGCSPSFRRLRPVRRVPPWWVPTGSASLRLVRTAFARCEEGTHRRSSLRWLRPAGPSAPVGACSDSTSDAPTFVTLSRWLSCPQGRSTRGSGKRGVLPCLRAAPSASAAPAFSFFPLRVRNSPTSKSQFSRVGGPRSIGDARSSVHAPRCQPHAPG